MINQELYSQAYLIDLCNQTLMKDQNNIVDEECKQDKWNRGLDLFIESVLKPDPALRQCAHNQRCYNELMEIRGCVLDHLKTMRWK